MITRAKAMQIRSLAMESAADMDDVSASSLPEMFPRLTQDGSLVPAGTRINWKGVVRKAAADLWDTRENDPDNAPGLWEEIYYIDGCRVIPETVSAAAAFAKGERGIWKGSVYASLQDNNVWNPEQFAAGWNKLI